MKKILSIIINILLVLIPFFPITENFTSNPVTNAEFGSYLGICIGIFVLMILLMFILKKDFLIGTYPLKRTAILLFILGMTVMIPLHLGPPKGDETIFSVSHIEKTRYALLIVSVLIFYAAVYYFLKNKWNILSRVDKLILVPLIVAFFILMWDNYDSFMYTEKIKEWIDSGKNPKDFYEQYILKNKYLHTVGRFSTYISIVWFVFLLTKNSFIKKWKGIVLGIFGIVGSVFCFLFLFVNHQFYFPFMIPAIVMAPAYWLGLSLVNQKIN